MEKNKTNPELSKDLLLEYGFEGLPTFSIMDSLTIDLGRERRLAIGCVGTPNEMMFLEEGEQNDVDRDVVVLHNYDFDGYLSLQKVKDLYRVITGKELKKK